LIRLIAHPPPDIKLIRALIRGSSGFRMREKKVRDLRGHASLWPLRYPLVIPSHPLMGTTTTPHLRVPGPMLNTSGADGAAMANDRRAAPVSETVDDPLRGLFVIWDLNNVRDSNS